MRKMVCAVWLISASLMACTPKVVERQFPVPKNNFGPRSSDKDLSLRVREYGEAAPDIAWEGRVSTVDFFEQAENLILLGEITGQSALKEKGLSWIKKFYSQKDSQRSSAMEETPFTGLVGNQTQVEVRPALINVLEEIEIARPIIREHILRLGVSTPQMADASDFESIIQTAEAFTTSVVDDLPSMNLAPVIEDGLRTELLAQTQPLFANARVYIARLPEAKTLTQILNLVDDAIAQFEVETPEDLAKSMKQGRKIAQSLDVMRDAQGGLRVLIDIWETLTPQEREEQFKPGNESLYDFLRKQDDKELRCLRTEGCSGGLYNGIAKKLFILPKIKDYGITKLKNEMNAKTRDFVMSSIVAFGIDFVKTMPETFAQQIDDGIVAKAGRIAAVKDDYITYIKKIFKTWSLKMLPETEGVVAGFESSFVNINLSNKRSFSMQAEAATDKIEASTIGAGLAASALMLQSMKETDPQGFSFALTQINKLVAIGGYRNTLEELVPSLLAPVAHKDRLLDIMDFEATKGSEFSFRIPDQIQLKDALHVHPDLNYSKDFSADSLIRQIHGLTAMLQFTADWKQSNFDHYLTPIQAQDVTHDAEDDALKRTLFPKDMLFSLNLGNIAVLMQDLTKEATSLFLLTLDNKVIWGDQYGNDMADTVVMAGIVDIKNGQRSSVSKTRDVARLLITIAEFLSATEGVEKTTSSILLEKDSSGERPLDVLIQGRKDLKLLSIALGNFLSNELMTKENLVRSSYDLDKMKLQSANYDYKLEDQLYSIRALLKAWDLTHIDAYQWAAQDIFFAMNKSFFNKKEEFYRQSHGEPVAFPTRVLTLLTMAELAPRLPAESQAQLRRISDPWIQSLLNIQ